MTPKILVIGFNRCGTLSLHKFFKRNRIPSIHYNVGNEILPIRMFANLSLGRPLLAGLEDYTAFSDLGLAWPEITFEAVRLFRDLHRDYPDAYFILNTRPVDNWIASRLMHINGDYAERYARMYGCERRDLIDLWTEQYKTHTDDVRRHFAGDEKFLEFDIENDPGTRLTEFLAPDFDTLPAHWGLSNETPEHARNPEPRRHSAGLATHERRTSATRERT